MVIHTDCFGLAWSAAIAIFVHTHWFDGEVSPDHLARMAYNNPEVLSDQTPVKFYFYFRNGGNLAAIGGIHSDNVKVHDGPMNNVEIDAAFASLRVTVNALEGENIDSETQPDDVKWWEPPQTISQRDYKSVLDGSRYLYLMTILKYKDKDLPKGKWRVTEMCIFMHAEKAFYTCNRHHRVYVSD